MSRRYPRTKSSSLVATSTPPDSSTPAELLAQALPQFVFDSDHLRSLPLARITAALNHAADLAISLGVNPRTINSLIVNACKAKSLELGTIEPFDAVAGLRTGSGFLGGTVSFISARNEARDLIAKQKHAEDEAALFSEGGINDSSRCPNRSKGNQVQTK
jgi:hypothetical protein